MLIIIIINILIIVNTFPESNGVEEYNDIRYIAVPNTNFPKNGNKIIYRTQIYYKITIEFATDNNVSLRNCTIHPK